MNQVHCQPRVMRRWPRRIALSACAVLLLAATAAAQQGAAPPDTLRLTIEDAVRIALERVGIAERIKPPGDRRDFYQIAEDAEVRVMRGHLERMHDLLQRLERGYRAVPPEQETVRRRFVQMIEMNRELTAVVREKLEVGKP